MNIKKTGWVNSALALTKTRVIQEYHVFAYVTASNLIDSEDQDSVRGCMIILASFSDEKSKTGEIISGKKLAIDYAKDIIAVSGYDNIYWIDSHRWLNLKARPVTSEICYVDDKSALENASESINQRALKKTEENQKFVESIEEERKLYRAQRNLDHVEHFIAHLLSINDAMKSIAEYEKKLEDAKVAFDEHLQQLRIHHKKHPNHEENALAILKERMNISDYLPIAYTYSKIKDDVTSEEKIPDVEHKIYEKKSGKDESGPSSRISGKDSASEKNGGEEQESGKESGKERSYSDVASGTSAPTDIWRSQSGNSRRRNRNTRKK